MTRHISTLALIGLMTQIISITSIARAEDKPDKPMKQLRHVVMFQFKETATDKDIKTITDAFAELPGKIGAIHGFEWGKNNSPEGLADGFTHCFLVTFLDEKGRDAYLPHPAHKEFVTLLKPHLEKVMVIDYWAAN